MPEPCTCNKIFTDESNPDITVFIDNKYIVIAYNNRVFVYNVDTREEILQIPSSLSFKSLWILDDILAFGDIDHNCSSGNVLVLYDLNTCELINTVCPPISEDNGYYGKFTDLGIIGIQDNTEPFWFTFDRQKSAMFKISLYGDTITEITSNESELGLSYIGNIPAHNHNNLVGIFGKNLCSDYPDQFRTLIYDNTMHFESAGGCHALNDSNRRWTYKYHIEGCACKNSCSLDQCNYFAMNSTHMFMWGDNDIYIYKIPIMSNPNEGVVQKIQAPYGHCVMLVCNDKFLVINEGSLGIPLYIYDAQSLSLIGRIKHEFFYPNIRSNNMFIQPGNGSKFIIAWWIDSTKEIPIYDLNAPTDADGFILPDTDPTLSKKMCVCKSINDVTCESTVAANEEIQPFKSIVYEAIDNSPFSH